MANKSNREKLYYTPDDCIREHPLWYMEYFPPFWLMSKFVDWKCRRKENRFKSFIEGEKERLESERVKIKKPPLEIAKRIVDAEEELSGLNQNAVERYRQIQDKTGVSPEHLVGYFDDMLKVVEKSEIEMAKLKSMWKKIVKAMARSEKRNYRDLSDEQVHGIAERSGTSEKDVRELLNFCIRMNDSEWYRAAVGEKPTARFFLGCLATLLLQGAVIGGVALAIYLIIYYIYIAWSN